MLIDRTPGPEAKLGDVIASSVVQPNVRGNAQATATRRSDLIL